MGKVELTSDPKRVFNFIMIIFLLSKEGFKELENIIHTGKYPVWVGGGVLTDVEISTVREKGVDLTTFSYLINLTDDKAIKEALATIAEHHPGERVWLEYQP